MIQPAISCGGVRVTWSRHQDRWAHVVAVQAGSAWSPVLESIEGGPGDDWPPSPPLQQLALESRPADRRVALLVGQSGRSHWSLSAEPADGIAAIDIAVACRMGRPAGYLGSRYAILPHWTGVAKGGAVELVGSANSLRIEGYEVTPESTHVRVSAGLVELLPEPIPLPGPSRWRYRLIATPVMPACP